MTWCKTRLKMGCMEPFKREITIIQENGKIKKIRKSEIGKINFDMTDFFEKIYF